jgi:hypothetical protein
MLSIKPLLAYNTTTWNSLARYFHSIMILLAVFSLSRLIVSVTYYFPVSNKADYQYVSGSPSFKVCGGWLPS